MIERFREHLEDTGLIPPGVRVLLGYSGGADSTCLLHLLHLAEVDVVAAHLHHSQRDEADSELVECEAFCERLGTPFVSGRADVPLMSKEMKIGLEEAGRKARYAFFQQAAFQLNCALIATAHTRTDHVETILMNLARGAGMSGLAGIPSRRDNIVRPFLPFTREEARAYCAEHSFWFHDDPSNEDVSLTRARIRHRVLPEFKAINPQAVDAISRMAEVVEEEDRFLNGMAAAALEQSEVALNGALEFLTRDCEVAFARSKLQTLPPVLFRRAMRLAAQAMGANLERDHTAKLELGVASLYSGSVTAEGGEIVVEWKDDIVHCRQLRPIEPFRYALTVPGETISEEFGWQFTVHPAQESRPIRQDRASLKVMVPASAIKGPLYFRSAQAGDTMRPLGFDGTRKLGDLLGEAHLTGAAKARLPIVCDLGGPLWAPGVCLDQRAKASSDHKETLILEFGPVREDPSHNMETEVR